MQRGVFSSWMVCLALASGACSSSPTPTVDAGSAVDVPADASAADTGAPEDVVTPTDQGGPADAGVPTDRGSTPEDVPAPEDVPTPQDVPAPEDVATDAGPACEAPNRLCGGACMSTQDNAQHCGACGAVCHGTCRAGACVPMVELVAGDGFNCARMMDGTVRCWGDNGFGQLGDGTTTARTQPGPAVPLPAPAVDLAAGDAHVCAQLINGQLYCWGRNNHGQLGRGSFDASGAPAAVSGLSDLVSVALGSEHTCVTEGALNGSARTVRCWGQGSAGQTGLGNTLDRNQPTEPVILPMATAPFTRLQAGGERTCVLSADTTGWRCWGRNRDGELGLPLARTDLTSGSPAPAMSQGSIFPLALGGRHVCLITSLRRITCNGDNSQGQVGTGTASPSTGFREMSSVRPAQAAGVGRAHSCALLRVGEMPPLVACWGGNTYGELGDGSNAPSSQSPVWVMGPEGNVERLAVGPEHSCAWRADGAAWCWGRDRNGFLGPGTGERRPTALPVRW